MARFGVEGIRYFSHARAAGFDVHDLTYTFDRCNGFDAVLRDKDHTRVFYFDNTNCWETDIRDASQGGSDTDYADAVDLFWIETHGNHTASGQALLLYDIAHDNWRTYSGQWELGEGTGHDAEWIMAYACSTVDRDKIEGLANIFAGLHIYCGAWDSMYDSWTTEECGEDVAENLVDGDAVAESWLDGVSDWWVDNHPIAVCVGDKATWNGGDVKWHLSYLNRDHLWGHGNVDPELSPSQQACFLAKWTEG